MPVKPRPRGDTIRSLRTKAGLSQEDLSARANLAPLTIIRLEREEKEPRPRSIRKLAEALGVPTEALYVEPEAAEAMRETPITATIGGGFVQYGTVEHFQQVARQLADEVEAVQRSEASNVTVGTMAEVDRFIAAAPHAPQTETLQELRREFIRLLGELSDHIEQSRRRLAEPGHEPAA